MSDAPLLTRRRVLAAAVAAVPVATAWTAWSWWTDPPMAGLRHISEDEHKFLLAIAEAGWPTGRWPGGGQIDVGAYVDEVIDGMAPFQAHLLRLAMHAIEQAPRLSHGRAFSDLDPADASVLLQGWLDSANAELRGTVVSLVLFCGMAWTSHPAIAPAINDSFWCGYGR